MAEEGEEAPAMDSDAAALAALVAQLDDDGAVKDGDEDAARMAELLAAQKPKLTKEQLRRNARKRRESVEKAVTRVERAREAGTRPNGSVRITVHALGTQVDRQ